MKAEQFPLYSPARLRGFLGVASCLALALFAGTAPAAVIDTYPDWDGSVTESYLKIAQSFVAPADKTLANWKFTLAPATIHTNVLFQIVLWNSASGPLGSPLFSRSMNWPSAGGDMFVDNISLTLTTGTRYAAVVDLLDYEGPSVNFQFNQNSYHQGNAAWFAGINPTWKYLDSTYNTAFRAEFVTIPEPAGLLGLALAGTLLWRGFIRSERN